MRRSDRHNRKSELLADRRLENLSTTVNDLFQKAIQNEKIMQRYQQFELKLLDLNSFETLLDMLLLNSIEYFQLDAVELWLYDPQHTLSELLPKEYIDLPNLRLISLCEELNNLYSLQPEVKLMSTKAGASLPVFHGQELHSVALLPLVRHGVIVGSLHFGTKTHERFTVDKSTDFIAHLASIVSVCIENAVSQERLNRLSMYDMLTKVKNRRAFHQSLDKEISRAIRSGEPLSLSFVDLDFFKQVNDSYGHQMGDKVLHEVAQFINDMLRKTDSVCRYGGEEFALVLPNCGRQRAMEISERIRQKISELKIVNDADGDDATAISITLSIGVCCWLPKGDLNAEARIEQEKIIATQIIACSDRGVYQSKASGRNCVSYIDYEDSSH